jgi:acylphosphatase
MVQHFLVKGRVQGVGFRWFVHREAAEIGVLAAGEPEQLEDLMKALGQGSRGSRVDEVIEHTLADSEGANLKTFEIEGAW